MQKEIQKLLSVRAVSVCEESTDQFLSNTFLIKKPDGDFRFILNLTDLNNWVKIEHFKLEDIRTACHLMYPSCFMARLDLKMPISVSISENHKKYLRFRFNDRIRVQSSMAFAKFYNRPILNINFAMAVANVS